MAPRSEEEKQRRKAEYLKRKEERQKLKEQEAKASKSKGSGTDAKKKSSESTGASGPSPLLALPEDALKQVLCSLAARDLGKVSMTCRHMNEALHDVRISFLLSRLRHSPVGPLKEISVCNNIDEARVMIDQSLGGGETGRMIVKRKGKNAKRKNADEFVAYARFLDEAVHGHVPLGFRAEGEKTPALAPRFVSGRFVSASPEHSLCRAGGDGQKCGAGGSGVASWGVGKRGQCGHGKREDEQEPRLIVGGIGYGIRIVQVAAGGGLVRVAHSLLLTSNGKVLSFGTGQYGALGHGYSAAKQLPDILRPTYIEALSHKQCICVAAGELHSAAVTVDGDVYTWGDGFCGQLGLGDKRPAVAPKHVEQGGLEDECVLSVSCGSRHTLAVTEDGEIWSWGLGHFGALGRSFTPFEYDADAAVVALGGEEAAVPVAMGHGAAAQDNEQQVAAEQLRAHLDLLCNLSLDDSSNQCIPMVVESLQLTKAIGASAGHRHSLFLDENGAVYACGAGRSGCLGVGDNDSQMYPVIVSEFVNEKVRIMKLSAGVDISMAVSTTGQVYSWGSMKGGRIGLGAANSYVNIPRRVTIHDDNGDNLKAVDCDCGYVHSLIVALNGTVHVCGGVGTDGKSDGQFEEEGDGPSSAGAGFPRVLPDFNLWHRVPEPKEHVKKEKWKKYGRYEVKGRSKMLSEE
ncbi:Ultraviolet-B receptor UVR8 [Seminavis robusta]|uniref:Ultraviolet-B receptor UVR8 n=1 Tax=Seminavis robusta TaxID=568900 RepID=A0A9N8HFN0_9STRA|nr:Ultraviolet-B receptor UVR8 [Seminavis robusta]|eukprot:Sro443_g143990.1 Ultraviolet-B receptor UVR8 (686) ;mRNA; r:8246-10854